MTPSKDRRTLAVLDPHPCLLSPEDFLQQCTLQFNRRSGPGGQHRNKTETAVTLTHQPTGIRAEASERRQQAENRGVAIERLRTILALQVRSPWAERLAANDANLPLVQHPAYAVWKRRMAGGTAPAARHRDFAILLVLTIDVLVSQQGQMSATAKLLQTSSGQLSRIWRQDGQVMAWVNDYRRSLGLGYLR